MYRSDTNCTLKRWYHVLPQAKITLNMVCPSRLNHQLFYQLHIASYFDYTTNAIGHPVTCVVANVKPTDCLYFSPNGNPWWYIVPTLENYHCYSVYINNTMEEQGINTVDFSPNSTIPCMEFGYEKTCAAHCVSRFSLPKIWHLHTINQVCYNLN